MSHTLFEWDHHRKIGKVIDSENSNRPSGVGRQTITMSIGDPYYRNLISDQNSFNVRKESYHEIFGLLVKSSGCALMNFSRARKETVQKVRILLVRTQKKNIR